MTAPIPPASPSANGRKRPVPPAPHAETRRVILKVERVVRSAINPLHYVRQTAVISYVQSDPRNYDQVLVPASPPRDSDSSEDEILAPETP